MSETKSWKCQILLLCCLDRATKLWGSPSSWWRSLCAKEPRPLVHSSDNQYQVALHVNEPSKSRSPSTQLYLPSWYYIEQRWPVPVQFDRHCRFLRKINNCYCFKQPSLKWFFYAAIVTGTMMNLWKMEGKWKWPKEDIVSQGGGGLLQNGHTHDWMHQVLGRTWDLDKFVKYQQSRKK